MVTNSHPISATPTETDCSERATGLLRAFLCGRRAAILSCVTDRDPVVPALLLWFAKHARDLPWRRTTDPYAIWIAEVMLQQTQVQTVIPFWERWLADVPDVRALAGMRFERILKLWEGLGYYTRARNLHRAAQVMVEQHNGEFPRAYEAVLALPGIGRYTAGAVCSIAFDQPRPILDGNAVRVLARLYGITGNVRLAKVKARLWRKAEELIQAADRTRRIPGRRCAMFNQAVMELGATICTPKHPRCSACPIRRFCTARRSGRTDRLPNSGRPTPSTQRQVVAFVVCQGQRVLVRQRPEGVVNAHLWEFPNVEVTAAGTSIEELAFQLVGCRPKAASLLCTVPHTITRFRIRLQVYQFSLGKAKTISTWAGRWCTLRELGNLPFPSAHRKILAALRSSQTLS
jgi:A/G-specific adenine glycosylase